jgi:hypothetical protein
MYPQVIHFNDISIINHPFWGFHILGNLHIDMYVLREMFGLRLGRAAKHPSRTPAAIPQQPRCNA